MKIGFIGAKVAVQPDEGDAALHLGAAHLCEGLVHAGGDGVQLGHLAGREFVGEFHVLRTAIAQPRITLPGADLVVRLGDVRTQVAQQPQPGVGQVGPDGGEVLVPHR